MWLMGSPRRGPDGEGDGWPPARTTPAQINPRIINSTYLIEWCLLVKQTEADDTEQEAERETERGARWDAEAGSWLSKEGFQPAL